jgi:hypothetical protein
MSPRTASKANVPQRRARPVARSLGLLVVAAALAFGLGGRASGAVEGQLLFNVEQNGNIRLTLANGTAVGATISPGTYSVIVRNLFKDDEGRNHYITLNGPGVQLLADINQGEQDDTSWTFVFQPSATYSWSDTQNTSLNGSFRTAAVASDPDPGYVGSSDSSSKSSAAEEPVGPLRGTLRGTVNRAGKLTLTFNGRAVSALKLTAGSYWIVVVDQTSRGAFSVELVKKKKRIARTITGLPFVGKKSVKVNLTPGRWTFYSTIYKKSPFNVV